MSLDKSIGKREWRKPYTGSKAIDRTCRNHGGCDWCKFNRLVATRREDERIKANIEEFNKEES